jgi:hypothetical protein
MVQFRTRGRGKQRRVYPVRKPYGEGKRRAEREVRRLRESGKRARLIKTNRRLNLYAPYESVMKDGKVVSVIHSQITPREVENVIKKVREEFMDIGSTVQPSPSQATISPTLKNESTRGNGYQEIEKEMSWDNFMEELKKRPKQKESKTNWEKQEAHTKENYNRLVREVGRIRDKTETKDGFKIPLNVKITVYPGGETADFYNGKKYVMSIGFAGGNRLGRGGARVYEESFFGKANLDFLTDPQSDLKEYATDRGPNGTSVLVGGGKTWRDAINWVNKTIDFNKVEKEDRA